MAQPGEQVSSANTNGLAEVDSNPVDGRPALVVAGRLRPRPRRFNAARAFCVAHAAPSGIARLRLSFPAAALVVLTIAVTGM